MNRFSFRNGVANVGTLGSMALVVMSFAACSSAGAGSGSHDAGSGSNGGDGAAGGTGVGTGDGGNAGDGAIGSRDSGGDAGAGSGDGAAPSACSPTSGLQIQFPNLYTAYETTHPYEIGAVVTGPNAASATWTASPASAVRIAPDATTTGGITITVSEAVTGPVTITATDPATHACAQASLHVTAATTAQWQAGHERYATDLSSFSSDCIRQVAGYPLPDGSTCPTAPPACDDCHGPTGYVPTIEDTPRQLGGLSDQEVVDIITQGIIPGCGTSGPCDDAGLFDPSNVYAGDASSPYEAWHRYHQWSDLQGSGAQSVVVYLRSLTSR